jgi:chemotaxis protein methyltransferase CheR
MTTHCSEFDYLCQLVYDHSAVVLGQGKTYLAELHLQPLLRSTGLETITNLVAQLKPDPFGPLAVQVVEALIVHETSWFRDGHPFQTLGATLLPKLIEARKQERSINIWSAAWALVKNKMN